MLNNVLFVDDEPHILKAIRRGLNKEKYNKFFANSSAEALQILESEDIHVIVTDMKMPEMNGLELLTIVKDKYPKIVKIILSGYTQLQQIIVTINRIDIYKFITKPWDMEIEFKQVILSAIDYYNTRDENDRLKISIEKKNELYQNMIKKNSAALGVTKENFRFLGKMNYNIMKYVQVLGDEVASNKITSGKFKEELDFLSRLFELMASYMPVVLEEFNKQYIDNKVHMFIKSKMNLEEEISLEVIDTTDNRKYIGQVNILVFIISVVAVNYYSNEKNSKTSIVLSEKKEEDQLFYVVLLQSEHNIVNFDKTRVNSLVLFFEILIRNIEGIVSFEKKDNQHLFLAKIPVEEG